jgi:hypothetical protein
MPIEMGFRIDANRMAELCHVAADDEVERLDPLGVGVPQA